MTRLRSGQAIEFSATPTMTRPADISSTFEMRPRQFSFSLNALSKAALKAVAAIATADSVAATPASISTANTRPSAGTPRAVAYVSTIDIPSRFCHSRSVGAILGLTPVLKQSGEMSRVGHVSLRGDAMMRRLLYEAAQSMMTRVVKWCWLKAWAMNIAKRHGSKKAKVALARRLAVIMHRMWVDGTEFRWTREDTVSTVAA